MSSKRPASLWLCGVGRVTHAANGYFDQYLERRAMVKRQ